MKKSTCDIVVIGGGAAGLMASSAASAKNARVLLLDKNDKLGKKLRITGKGRCNITNNRDIRAIIDNLPRGGRFLQGALTKFSAQDTMTFFEELGVRVKTERGERVFPVSDSANEVADALVRHARKTGVCIETAAAVSVLTENGSVIGVKTKNGVILCSAAIVAAGGLSYPLTGSTGDGYKMARELGHTVTAQSPSLVPLVEDGDCCGQMQGLALRNIRVFVFDGGKKPIYEDFGELLFTHFGLSGPVILSSSAHMRDFDNKKYHILIDLKPGLDEKKLDTRILSDFAKYSNRDFSNALSDLLNRLIIPVVVARSGIPPDTKVHSISREQRQALLSTIKGFRIDIASARPVDEAVVTSGGISLKEITPSTMESKLIKGLFFAGEVIDADAYTGGYNLQIAWSTGHLAGESAAKFITEQQVENNGE